MDDLPNSLDQRQATWYVVRYLLQRINTSGLEGIKKAIIDDGGKSTKASPLQNL